MKADSWALFEDVRSDALDLLRGSRAHLKRLNLDLGLIAQFSLVVDTNIIIKELLWLTSCRKNPDAPLCQTVVRQLHHSN